MMTLQITTTLEIKKNLESAVEELVAAAVAEREAAQRSGDDQDMRGRWDGVAAAMATQWGGVAE